MIREEGTEFGLAAKLNKLRNIELNANVEVGFVEVAKEVVSRTSRPLVEIQVLVRHELIVSDQMSDTL